MTVLPNLAQQLEMMKAENVKLLAALAASQRPKAITMKVSEKGALSLYGLGRFPITLYRGQIERLLDHAPAIRAFIDANADALSVKS